MNKLIAFCLIASFIYLIQAQSNPLNTQWPRQDQPCQGSVYGWFWDGQKCEQCYSDNCACNTYNGCTSCQAGYFLRQYSDGHWNCDSCNGGSRQNIQTCCPVYDANNAFLDYHATKCFDNANDGSQTYQQYGSVCLKVASCTSYTDYGRCQSCARGFYLNENSECSACVANAQCVECQDVNTCSACQVGYYLATYKGSSNPDSADTLKKASLCKACATNCICQDGSTAATSCQDCLPNLKQAGFFYDSQAQKCTACIANCKTCSDTVKCSTCKDQFIVDNTGKCQPCPANCQACSFDTTNSATSCNSGNCFNGYFEFKSDPAKPIVNCNACPDTNGFRCNGSDGKQTVFCLYDLPAKRAPHTTGYYLVPGDNGGAIQCLKNDNNCKTMNSKGKCDSCYSDLGWYKTTSGVCKQCQIEKSNCITCSPNNSDGLDCLSCPNSIQKSDWLNEVQNFFVDSTKSCKPCSTGCYNCQSDTVCNQCQLGFQLNSNKGCDKCTITNCQSCSGNINSCQTCFAGLRVWNNPSTDPAQTKCEVCDANCLNCDSNRKQCTQCTGGYYLINGVCKVMKNNCLSQRLDGPCLVCQYGYRLVSGWCFSCIQPGYVNCPYLCTNLEYTRDGDLLTSAYEKQRYPAVYLSKLTSSILILAMIICAILI